jgi:ketosteroid isomerase-like protein
VTEANVEALQRGYEALNRDDLSVVLELLDPDIEWHEPEPSPEARPSAWKPSGIPTRR